MSAQEHADFDYDTGKTGRVAESKKPAAPKRKPRKPKPPSDTAPAKVTAPKTPGKAKKPTTRNEKGTVEGIGDNARVQLQSFARRISNLEDDRAEINSDIKEVYAEAKSNGFDTKVLRKAIAALKQDESEREEQQALLDLYMDAIRYAKQEDGDDA